jgi:hypothetical protein
MGKPTEDELRMALEEAARMRESGADPHFVAKALLNLNYRTKSLEQVLNATERYLRSGQAVSDHQHMVEAIRNYHRLDDRAAGHDAERFGNL